MTTNANNQSTIASVQGSTMNTSINTQLNTMANTQDDIMNTIEKDLISDFLSGSSSLPTALKTGLSASFEAAKDKSKVIQAERTNKALSLIVAHHMINDVGGKDTWLGDVIFTTAIRSSFWWKNSPKDNPTTSHGKLIRNALNTVIGEDSDVSKMFDAALRFFKGYEIHKDEHENETLVTVTINKQTKKREIEKVKELLKSRVCVSLTPSGIKIGVKYNSVITPIKGQEFVFNRNVQQTYGTNIINAHLEDVLKSIRIHNEYEEMIDERTSDKTITKYREYAYKFNREDALVMLLLLKENNIDIKELFKFKREGLNKVLVLSRKEKFKGVKSLNRVTVPAHTFKEKYGKSGVTSTNDAKQGFVVPMTNIARMIEFVNHEGNDIVFLRENANKMASRFDKLNNAKALWVRSIKCFVVADTTDNSNLELNKALVGGNILVPDSILLSDGVCRVVSDMDQGGIKASYTPFAGLDEDLRDGDTCVIGVNGFKGGLLSAVALSKGDLNYIPNLTRLIDANTLVEVNKLPSSIVEQIQYESTTIVNYLYNELMGSLTTMLIGGKEVQGVMVTVDIKVSNPYTLDSLQYTNEEDESLTDGQKAVEEAKTRIENVVEEMESGVRPSTGIRAFIAEQKAGSADLFSVYDWMTDGIKNGEIKKKALTTKVISQEIQSIAHWEGKDVAIAFLNELLEEQKEQGFSVNKLYAYQLLGFFDRDTLNSVDFTDIVNILLNSNKGIVEGSPVYFKETMQEILDLISVHSSYGWLTVDFANGSVEIPMGSVFVGDTLEQMQDETKSYVIAKGLLADLLEVVKTTVTDSGEIYTNSKHHLVMETFVQRPLLGKNFGYQFTKGYYGVALPLIGNYGVTTIAITNRDRMEKSDDTWIPMTFSKSPQYFKGMTATYNVMNMNLGHKLNTIMECAIFINPEMFISVGNDFDGDLGRLSKGKTLPYVTLNYNEFNGNFFKEMYLDELGGNKFKAKKAQQCSLEDYHRAIYDAVMAKNNVGAYTANSYFYEAMIPNLIGTSFFGTKGKEIIVTEDMAYKLNAILKMLIQVEAMDNMKQEGASTFITEMLFNYKLRGLNENRIESHLAGIIKALMSLVKKVDIQLTQEEVEDLVELAYFTSIKFSKDVTTSFNLFGASNINIKALNNVMEHISTGCELDTIYNFKDCYENILNGVDTESMYYQMILSTGEALETSNFKIRA